MAAHLAQVARSLAANARAAEVEAEHEARSCCSAGDPAGAVVAREEAIHWQAEVRHGGGGVAQGGDWKQLEMRELSKQSL
eukprot:scaffold178737_cov16-Tisochrysis_lutea.AAC.3